MSVPPQRRRATPLPRGYSVAAVVGLVLLGGTMWWINRPDPPPAPPPDMGEVTRDLNQQPLQNVLTKYRFHSVTTTEENGRSVVKLRVAPEGDEIIVDAATGRLLETRPYQPMQPIGKMPVPIQPTM